VTRLTSQFKQLEQARQRDLKAARKTMRVEMNKLDKAASRAMVDLNRIDMQIKVRVVLRSLVLPHAHTRARARAWLCGCVAVSVCVWVCRLPKRIGAVQNYSSVRLARRSDACPTPALRVTSWRYDALNARVFAPS